VSGVGIAELRERGSSIGTRLEVVRPTLAFVAGFTVVFVALGAGASALGQLLVEHRRLLNQAAGWLVIAMGLFLAGVISPRPFQAERRFHVSPSGLGTWAPPVMGMAFAFGWTPCLGPILTGVLALATDSTTLGRGVVLLFVYSLGLGVPFLLTGLALGRLAGVFSWVGRHHRAINLVAGLALVAFGVLLVTNRVSWLAIRIIELMKLIGLDFLTRI
jgi:cytochrome c-type biogenesis protein